MSRMRLFSFALVVILALAACQTTTETGGLALTADPDADVDLLVDTARPWKASIDWFMTSVSWAGDPFTPAAQRSTFDGRCDTPSDFLMIGSGRAQSSHMGRVAYTYEQCTRYLAPQPGVTWEGVMTFVAADGSSVVTTYTGGATADFEMMGYVLDYAYAITGGTGRFDGVSGGGPGGGVVTWVDIVKVFESQATMSVEIDGHIVYAPAKARGR
jgi:hypothetical protein